MRRNLVLLGMVLFVATGCHCRKPQVSVSESAVDPKSPLIQEAVRLRVPEAAQYRERVAKLSSDLLIEELFRTWADEDTRPENLVKCYQEHKQDFAKHYRRIYSLVDARANSADGLSEWRRRLQSGEDFRELAAKGCTAVKGGLKVYRQGGIKVYHLG